MAVPGAVFGATSSGRSAVHTPQATHSVVVHNGTANVITVHAGDTLWSLSRRYGVSVAHLERWNHLTDHSILQIGQQVIVGWRSAGAVTTSRRGTALSGRGSSVTAEAAGAILGERIAQYAEQFVGVPYRWGGESSAGFDCSGLVQFTFAHFGISLGRSSFDQYQQGVPVSRSDLLPGDLVFFNAYGDGPSHVGIYIGGDRFVNAASGGVRVDSLGESYWAAHYLGARRIL